ncbi:MAG: cytochrome c [Saprospiraceae bacterium]
MKKYKIFITLGIIVLSVVILAESCVTSQLVADKEGSQLWSENCGRCHNAPAGSVYSNNEWDLIGTHMRMRAQLTADETRKIVSFLQTPATE